MGSEMCIRDRYNIDRLAVEPLEPAEITGNAITIEASILSVVSLACLDLELLD